MPKPGLPRLKKWGQHFLEDEYYLELIAVSGKLTPQDRILEIGPGDGRLTELLLDSGATVIAVEIDPRLSEELLIRFSANSRFTLINKDFLKLSSSEIENIFGGSQRLKVIANLPYYVTTPILTRLLEFREHLEMLILMMQKEVGERLTAVIGSRGAGALTLYLQYYATLEIINTVPATAFRPRPQVDSVIIRITPRSAPAVAVREEALFWSVIKAAFSQRRKMLINALAAQNIKGINKLNVKTGLRELGLSPKIRGENMTLEEFASLCNFLAQ